MKTRNGFVSNSSSSSFICDTGMSLEKVKEALEAIRKVATLLKINDPTDYYGEMWEEPFIADQKYVERMEWWLDYYNKSPSEVVGKIIINSVSDNTIPYVLHELIENGFDADRMHLG